MPRKNKQLTVVAPKDDWNKRVQVIMGHMMFHWECDILFGVGGGPKHRHKGFNHDATV
jgi:hypothetical protein